MGPGVRRDDGARHDAHSRPLTTTTSTKPKPTSPKEHHPMDYDITDAAPEHKAGIAVRDEFDELRSTFEQFKAANDERLAAVERRRPDPLLEEKVERINAVVETQSRRIDEFTLKQARPALEMRGRVPQDAAAREHRNAFD